MNNQKNSKKYIPTPIERHDTAAWASIERIIPESRVSIPSEFQVENAKLHVDANQK